MMTSTGNAVASCHDATPAPGGGDANSRDIGKTSKYPSINQTHKEHAAVRGHCRQRHCFTSGRTSAGTCYRPRPLPPTALLYKRQHFSRKGWLRQDAVAKVEGPASE